MPGNTLKIIYVRVCVLRVLVIHTLDDKQFLLFLLQHMPR